jgi:hypothetical protein
MIIFFRIFKPTLFNFNHSSLKSGVVVIQNQFIYQAFFLVNIILHFHGSSPSRLGVYYTSVCHGEMDFNQKTQNRDPRRQPPDQQPWREQFVPTRVSFTAASRVFLNEFFSTRTLLYNAAVCWAMQFCKSSVSLICIQSVAWNSPIHSLVGGAVWHFFLPLFPFFCEPWGLGASAITFGAAKVIITVIAASATANYKHLSVIAISDLAQISRRSGRTGVKPQIHEPICSCTEHRPCIIRSRLKDSF